MHQVDPGHQLGHRMLDLEAGVHLEEVEAAVGVEQELDGAGADVAHRRRRLHRRRSHGATQLGREHRRGRFLDHLLVAALERALALAERDHVAVLVAEHLDLDVARPHQELLDVHRVVAEARQRLRARGAKRRRQIRRRGHHPHALAAAAGGGLEHHRVAHRRGGALGAGEIGQRLIAAGNDRNALLDREPAALDLRAHRRDRLRAWVR